jgi:hypothetical protein
MLPTSNGQLAMAAELSPEVPAPLNNEEQIRLDQLETVIEHSLQSFLVVGRCLLEVRDRKLYRQHYPNFQTYCIKRWGISERRGLDLARSTAVAEHLLSGPAAPNGDSPLPPDLAENVMRPLSKLEPELQAECWRLASRITERPTHFVVSRIVRVVTEAIGVGLAKTLLVTNKPGGPNPKRPVSCAPSFYSPAYRSPMRESSLSTSVKTLGRRAGPWWHVAGSSTGAKRFLKHY